MAVGPSRGAIPSLVHAQPLADVLRTPVLAGATVLAGADGLGRPVERLNVMEVPDILPWVKPREFLLTTAYPLHGRPETLPQLVRDLDAAGLAGLGIKLGRYLDAVPSAVLEVAEERAFPLVRLPANVSFDDIFNEVLTGILNQQAQKLARSERIHRAFLQLVLRGQGVPEIARDLAELVEGPAVLVDGDGQVLAAAGLEQLPTFDHGTPTRLVVHPDGHRATTVDGTELACVAVPITAGTRNHGHVVALAANGTLTDDLLALENAATVAALALTQRMEVQAVESKYQSDLVHDLLRGVEDPADVHRRAGAFGWDLDRTLTVLVLRLDEPDAVEPSDEGPRRPPLASVLRPVVQERDPGAAVVRFSHEVVIVTGAFDGADGRPVAQGFARQLVRRATRAVGGAASVGISRPVADLTAIADAYEQATRALVIGRQVQGTGAVAHFDELGAYRLLSLIDDHEELRSFATEVLGELTADTPSAADLRHTLEVLLESGGNVAEAARRLHFHYNTLRYRIDKLEGIVGPFTSDARVRLDVQLGLLVLSMRGLDQRR